jgi:uncharacterized membrane protein (DUF4010 family)
MVAGRRVILVDDNEERAVPARHAVGLLVAEDEVLKVVLGIAAAAVLVRQEPLVVLATSLGRRSYVQLLDC